MRHLSRQPLDGIPRLKESLEGHVDIPRLRKGRVGAVFHIAFAPCDTDDVGPDFILPSRSVEYAMESIDLIHEMVKELPDDLALALTAQSVRDNFANGKISALIGVEGGHHLGNSLAVLRLFYSLGARYLTLTHTSHNSFASSAGSGAPITSVHAGNGLTDFGRDLVPEMNRLGMMVDLSHTSDETMAHALDNTVAPVIFSHSGARAINNHPRNVPDHILQRIGAGPEKNNGVVLMVFYPAFVDPANPTLSRVADHIDYIAKICGKQHVGLGSDFDGINHTIQGLEDASKFPDLIMELLSRGWSDEELKDLAGRNILRVMEEVENVSRKLSSQGVKASRAIYSKRADCPVSWGGPNDAYLPADVKAAIQRSTRA